MDYQDSFWNKSIELIQAGLGNGFLMKNLQKIGGDVQIQAQPNSNENIPSIVEAPKEENNGDLEQPNEEQVDLKPTA